MTEPPAATRAGDSVIVRGFRNVVATGNSRVTIRNHAVSVWILGALGAAVVVIGVGLVLVMRSLDGDAERMDGVFNVAVAPFDQVNGGESSLSDDQLQAVADNVYEALLIDAGDDDAVLVWPPAKTGAVGAFGNEEAAAERAGAIGADLVVTGRVTPLRANAATVDIEIHAFGDAGVDRAAPPVRLDELVGTTEAFDPTRPRSLRDLPTIRLLRGLADTLGFIDLDDYWRAAATLENTRRAQPEAESLDLLEGLIMLRWSAAEETVGAPESAPPVGVDYQPPAEGLLARAEQRLDRYSGPSPSAALFRADVDYLKVVTDPAVATLPAERFDVIDAGYAALADSTDSLRTTYVEFMRGQIASLRMLVGDTNAADGALAHFEAALAAIDDGDLDVLAPFASGAWAGIGTVHLQTDPQDAAAAVDAFTRARDLASPAFATRYVEPLALSLGLAGRACDGLELLAAEAATLDIDDLRVALTAECPDADTP